MLKIQALKYKSGKYLLENLDFRRGDEVKDIIKFILTRKKGLLSYRYHYGLENDKSKYLATACRRTPNDKTSKNDLETLEKFFTKYNEYCEFWKNTTPNFIVSEELYEMIAKKFKNVNFKVGLRYIKHDQIKVISKVTKAGLKAGKEYILKSSNEMWSFLKI